MNGFWYPWGTAINPDTSSPAYTGLPANGNTPEQYVAAWQYVHGLFEAQDVTNVTWVWAPNVNFTNSTPLGDIYPGDQYVDWVGVDGYNFGAPWKVFFDVFDATLTDVDMPAGKPLMITETASTENGGDKAGWITDFFAKLAALPAAWPDIHGFVWFNFDKSSDPGGIDWRIQSAPSPGSTVTEQAFAAGLVTPPFRAAPAPLRRRDTT
jgi:mannan endo-1,4-beta-mannosidase